MVQNLRRKFRAEGTIAINRESCAHRRHTAKAHCLPTRALENGEPQPVNVCARTELDQSRFAFNLCTGVVDRER